MTSWSKPSDQRFFRIGGWKKCRQTVIIFLRLLPAPIRNSWVTFRSSHVVLGSVCNDSWCFSALSSDVRNDAMIETKKNPFPFRIPLLSTSRTLPCWALTRELGHTPKPILSPPLPVDDNSSSLFFACAPATTPSRKMGSIPQMRLKHIPLFVRSRSSKEAEQHSI